MAWAGCKRNPFNAEYYAPSADWWTDGQLTPYVTSLTDDGRRSPHMPAILYLFIYILCFRHSAGDRLGDVADVAGN